MLCIYNFLVTIKAIARVILAVVIVGITVPETEACSGGSEPTTTKSAAVTNAPVTTTAQATTAPAATTMGTTTVPATTAPATTAPVTTAPTTGKSEGMQGDFLCLSTYMALFLIEEEYSKNRYVILSLYFWCYELELLVNS